MKGRCAGKDYDEFGGAIYPGKVGIVVQAVDMPGNVGERRVDCE